MLLRFGEPETFEDARNIIAHWEQVYDDIFEYIKSKRYGNERAYVQLDKFISVLLQGIIKIRERADC